MQILFMCYLNFAHQSLILVNMVHTNSDNNSDNTVTDSAGAQRIV